MEEDDGQVDRIVPVAGMKDLTSFKHLFNGSVRKKMANDHIWVSVLSRPTRSNFTRVQRVSCCVALLFLTMITNCMFFRGDAEQSQEKVEAINVSDTCCLVGCISSQQFEVAFPFLRTSRNDHLKSYERKVDNLLIKEPNDSVFKETSKNPEGEQIPLLSEGRCTQKLGKGEVH